LIAIAGSALLVGCSDSNDMTSPGPVGVSADLSGSWSGQYQSNTPTLCSSGMASASFTQNGNQVTGAFKALGCGIDGTFRGTISGNLVTGTVGMLGCTGGGVSGRFENGALSLTVGDFHKDLIAGDVEVLAGGQVSLQR
ncbi:MAG: hypothetical protein ABW056_10965, partial [Thermoanaerobaculia bacterium]